MDFKANTLTDAMEKNQCKKNKKGIHAEERIYHHTDAVGCSTPPPIYLDGGSE